MLLLFFLSIFFFEGLMLAHVNYAVAHPPNGFVIYNRLYTKWEVVSELKKKNYYEIAESGI